MEQAMTHDAREPMRDAGNDGILDGETALVNPWRRWVIILTGVLLAMAVAYLAKGYRFLLFRPQPSDLYQRWQETRRVLSGRNPYLREPWASPYPPSSYVTLLPLVWPDFPWVKWYFGLINAVCVATGAWWGAVNGRAGGRVGKWFGAASYLGIGAICTTLGVGQMGVVVVALLIYVMVLADAGWEAMAGLVFGFALVKPTMGGLFIFPFLAHKHFRLFVVASLYVLLGSAAVLAFTHTTPLEFLRVWRAMTDDGGLDQGLGLVHLLQHVLPLDAKTMMVVIAAPVTAGTIATCVMFHRRPLWVLMAVASVGGRLWSYHTHYDSVMVAFLMIAMTRHWLETRRTTALMGLLLAGLTLWPPAKVTEIAAFQLFQAAAWIVCAALLVAGTKDRDLEAPAPVGSAAV